MLMRFLIQFVSAVAICGSATAEVMSLPVPLRTVYPGESLVSGDFIDKAFDVSAQARRTFVISATQATNKKAVRTLVAGKPIALAALKRESDVERNQSVLVVFSEGGLTVQASLVAQEDGYVDDIVQAKNTASGQFVAVRITGKRRAEVLGQ